MQTSALAGSRGVSAVQPGRPSATLHHELVVLDSHERDLDSDRVVTSIGLSGGDIVRFTTARSSHM